MRLTALVIFLGILAVRLATLSPLLALSHDSASYLLDIIHGPSDPAYYNPHHVLFHPLADGWLEMVQTAGFQGDPAILSASLNAFAGAGLIAVLYLVLKGPVGLPQTYAVLGALLPATFFGVWYYSVSLEVYIVPLLLLVSAVGVLLGAPTIRGAVIVGLLHGLAMTFHQVHVIFGLVVVAQVLWVVRLRGPEAMRFLAAYIAAGSSVVIPVYAWVVLGPMKAENIPDTINWLTLYAHKADSSWAIPSPSTLLKAAVGLVRSLVGMHFSFALEAVREQASASFPNHYLGDEIYLVRNVSPAVAVALLGASAALAISVVTAFGIALLRLGRLADRRRLAGCLFAIWFGVYAVFFICWDPFNVEFWIPQSICLAAVIVVAFAPAAPGRPALAGGVIALACAGLAAVNLIGSIGPAGKRANDVYRHELAGLTGAAGSRDLVVLGRTFILAEYVELLTGARTLSLDHLAMNATSSDELVGAALERIAKTRSAGGRVFFVRSTLDLEPQMLRLLTPPQQANMKLAIAQLQRELSGCVAAQDAYLDRLVEPEGAASCRLPTPLASEPVTRSRTSG